MPYEPRRHLADRPVAADRPQRQAGGHRGVRVLPDAQARATSRWRWTSSAATSSSPTSTSTGSSRTSDRQLRQLQGQGHRRALRQAGARGRPRGAQEAASGSSRSGCSTRRRTTSTRCSGTASSRTTRKVKGWTITPSHYLNNQLDTVWLDGVSRQAPATDGGPPPGRAGALQGRPGRRRCWQVPR